MSANAFTNLQNDFFRNLNLVVEPWIRLGVASPVCTPTGLIVLETTGRKSGRKFNVPLLATRFGRYVFVSTFRSESQWVKNIEANPPVRYWIGGKAHVGVALVLSQDSTGDNLENLPPTLRNFAQNLNQYFRAFGGYAAVLLPQENQ
ncbi:MAG: nitroreductase/quinone reductase family protein [Acidobacteriota bacterium]